jgi:periplasmic divalent cation tolerance protein
VEDFIIVLVTVSSREEGEELALKLINAGLSPCVNIIPECRSVYQWKGEYVKDNEALMLVKSRSDQFDELRQVVEKAHSYDVPEIISVKVDEMSVKYGAYIKDFFKQ